MNSKYQWILICLVLDFYEFVYYFMEYWTFFYFNYSFVIIFIIDYIFFMIIVIINMFKHHTGWGSNAPLWSTSLTWPYFGMDFNRSRLLSSRSSCYPVWRIILEALWTFGSLTMRDYYAYPLWLTDLPFKTSWFTEPPVQDCIQPNSFLFILLEEMFRRSLQPLVYNVRSLHLPYVVYWSIPHGLLISHSRPPSAWQVGIWWSNLQGRYGWPLWTRFFLHSWICML